VEAVRDRSLLLEDKRWLPDELMLKWKGLPADAIATVYIPGQNMEFSLQLASYLRPGANSLSLIDAHTVQCRVGDVTYLPILPGGGANIPGLLTITLPPSVKTGTTYRVSAHQISGVHRRVIGSFDMMIPVSQGHLLLPGAHRDLTVLREIGATIPAGDRWSPVFSRYLDVLADRVRGFGGNPDAPLEGENEGHHGHCATGLIETICYDCNGGFVGFVLDTCDGPLRFKASSGRIHRIVTEAASACHKVTVEWRPGHPGHVHAICVQTGDRHG
jgi:hypothetical protein